MFSMTIGSHQDRNCPVPVDIESISSEIEWPWPSEADLRKVSATRVLEAQLAHFVLYGEYSCKEEPNLLP